MSKHRRKANKKWKGAAVIAVAPILVTTGASPAIAQPATAWDEVIHCESGGQNIENTQGSSASGYFQIIDGTWVGAGGLEFAPRAIDATFEEQAIVAQRIAERRGSLADWNASKGCWESDIDSTVPDGPADTAVVAAEEVPLEQAPVESPVVPTIATDTYTVVAGDTLAEIGTALGLNWIDIANLNGIADPYIIHVGQVLSLPLSEYVVEPGDTLSEIATEEFGLPTWEPLYEQNKEVIGENPNLIYPGQVYFVGGLPLANPPVVIEQSDESPSVVYGLSHYHPVPGGTFTSGYGDRNGVFHDGIDIAAAEGTPIYATTSGQVVAAGCGVSGFGCWVRIRDLDGVVHTYGHINSTANIHVLEGQWVDAGKHIADIGNAGQSTGPHLHYRLGLGEANDALPLNPETWLADRGIFVR